MYMYFMYLLLNIFMSEITAWEIPSPSNPLIHYENAVYTKGTHKSIWFGLILLI